MLNIGRIVCVVATLTTSAALSADDNDSADSNHDNNTNHDNEDFRVVGALRPSFGVEGGVSRTPGFELGGILELGVRPFSHAWYLVGPILEFGHTFGDTRGRVGFGAFVYLPIPTVEQLGLGLAGGVSYRSETLTESGYAGWWKAGLQVRTQIGFLTHAFSVYFRGEHLMRPNFPMGYAVGTEIDVLLPVYWVLLRSNGWGDKTRNWI